MRGVGAEAGVKGRRRAEAGADVGVGAEAEAGVKG